MLKEDVSSIVPMPPSTQRAFRPVTEIAESLSAQLEIESEVGVGTSVSLLVPPPERS